jgi:Flp pilus assembly protein TadG
MEQTTQCKPHRSAHYFSDSRGAVAIIFALALVPFMLVTGMALETTRVSYFDTELAYACDAGAIAGARYQPADATTNITKFFNTNFTQGSTTTVTPNITVSPDGTAVTVSANATMPTYLGGFAGITSMNVGSSSQVLRTFQNAELALVLDNTGSMASNGKIAGLRAAATNLINIVFQNQATSNTMAVSIVPYVAAVNIGNTHTNWLSNPALLSSFPTNAPWAGCVGAVDTDPTMDSDDPPSSSRKWPVYFVASTYGLFGAQTGNNDWNIVGSNLNVVNPILDGGTGTYVTVGPNRSCGLSIQPLTNNSATLLSKINDMQPVPGGGTFGNLGLVWGWNTISPKWAGQWGSIDTKPYNQIQKYLVIITDGEDQWYAAPGYVPNGDPTAYGYSQPSPNFLAQGLLGTTDINSSRTYIDNRLSNLCSQINAAGIQIFTVTFEVSDSLAKQIYANCATKPEYAFQAESSQDLYDIFQNIGNITQSIRIVK